MNRALLKSCCLAALLAAGPVIAGQATAPAEPAFTPVQAEQFGVPGSLSNAWADFDGDGDPDFAVSLKSGEIRLYRNDKGRSPASAPRWDCPPKAASSAR